MQACEQNDRVAWKRRKLQGMMHIHTQQKILRCFETSDTLAVLTVRF